PHAGQRGSAHRRQLVRPASGPRADSEHLRGKDALPAALRRSLYQHFPNRIDELSTLLRPHLDKGYDGEVKRIRDLIVGRYNYLHKMLSEPPPQPLLF